MKNVRIFSSLIFVLVLMISSSFNPATKPAQAGLSGAWSLQDGTTEHLIIFAGNYYTYTEYDRTNKTFGSSSGGTYKLLNNQIQTTVEYNSGSSEKVGTAENYPYTQESDNLTIEIEGNQAGFKRVDPGTGGLSGIWRITGRMQEDKMVPMQSGPRKTLKILSGTRFQWVAMNTETKEFFGTGGGTYTFTNGKYIENIEFFSRDSSRVGVSLTFDGKLENDAWHHSGESSKGEKIHEVWSRVK